MIIFGRVWLLLLLAVCSITKAKIGYFWHMSDIHYDVNYSVSGDARKRCWNVDQTVGTPVQPLGRYGDFNCESPWALVESAVRAMKQVQGDNFEFILWTGDGLTHFGGGHLTQQQLHSLQNVTDLLRHTFSSHFVFPVLGQQDSVEPSKNYWNSGYRDLANLWGFWLPTEAIHTFTKGGYYTIEHKFMNLRLIALNTNLLSGAVGKEDDPGGQWIWLETILAKSSRNKEAVYLVGHIPPGMDERHGGEQPIGQSSFQPRFNHMYIQLVRRYSHVIAGQFFGHLHSDTFRVIYSDTRDPVSWALIAPTISPKRTTGGANNPGIRLYKFDTENGKVLDYLQLYLNLQDQRQGKISSWQVEYNFTNNYNIPEITAESLHNLAESFTSTQSSSFAKYYHYNSVSLNSQGTDSCNSKCLQRHYCAVTNVDYHEYYMCLELAASALSTSSATAATVSTAPPYWSIVLMLISQFS